MNITWKFVEKVDKIVFKEFKDKYGIEVPTDLQKLILEANAGTPTPDTIDDELGNVRVLGAILSYSDKVKTTIFKALKHIPNENYFPFAVDPFGNYFCEDLKTGTIVFFNHENDEFTKISNSLDEFLKNLH